MLDVVVLSVYDPTKWLILQVCRREVSNTRGTQIDRKIRASKTRVVRMLVAVTVIFALSWLPLYLLKFRILLGSTLKRTERALYFDYLIPVAQWLGSANCCINPLIYCYFSSSFRESTKTVLKCLLAFVVACCCRSRGCVSQKNDSNAVKDETQPRPTSPVLYNTKQDSEFKMVVVANV